MSKDMRADAPTSEPRVVHNAAEHKYEIYVGEERAGFAAYREEPGRIVFTHTVVEPAFEGRGLGSRLAASALDDARRRGLPVVPLCEFIAGYIERHPEYADLVSSGPKPR